MKYEELKKTLEGRGYREVTDEGLRRLAERGASDDLLNAAGKKRRRWLLNRPLKRWWG